MRDPGLRRPRPNLRHPPPLLLPVVVAPAPSKEVFQGMAVEQGAELETLAEHVEALVPAEPFQLGGMGARSHPGAESAAL